MEDISTIAFAGVRDLDPTAVKPTIGDQVSRRDEAALSHGVGEGGDDVGDVHRSPPLLQETDSIRTVLDR
jgi:hypothetical protein